VKFVQEKKLIQKYFNEISQDTGRYCFGVEDTFQALELGAVESLIVYENLAINRYTLKNPQTEEEYIKILTKKEEEDPSNFVDPETNVNLETVEQVTLLEWLAENYKQYGCALEFVTNKSQEGSQFVKGFGGIGGLLRYKVDFAQLNYDSDEYYSD
ncbi:Erf1 C-Domain, &quotclosed', partial [Globomyces pollinis-pini]